MTTDILIATCLKDIEYLEYCVRSVHKFASGFNKLVLVVGADEEPHFRMFSQGAIIKTYQRPSDPVKYQIAAQAQKCMADLHCEADFILHTDSDCAFTEPVTPEDYFVNGKPVMLIRPFSTLPGSPWKEPTEKALGFPVEFECMARHPQVNPRGLYGDVRRRIEQIHGKQFEQYVLSQRGEFPFGFSEHCALGAYALHDSIWSITYHWINTAIHVRPKDKLYQAWSHSPPNLPQDLPSGGRGTPLELYRQLGL
jgi:hypothetical protein